MVETCYPKFAAANKQQLIRDHFVHSLPSDYQTFLLSTNAGKIDEALNSALLYESMKSKTDEKNKGMTQSKFSGKLRNRNHNSQSYTVSDNRAANSTKHKDDLCHFCGKKGHYARDCYKKKNYNERKTQNNVESVAARYFLTLQIGDGIEELLLDTGASESIIPAVRYDAENKWKAENKSTLADGSQMSASGTINLPVKTLDGNFLLEHNFTVAPVNKCYIGTDVLELLGAVVDIKMKIVKTADGLRLPLHAASAASGQQSTVVSSLDIDDVHFLTKETPQIYPDVGTCVDEMLTMKINNLADKYEDIFSGIGKPDLVKCYINTTDNVPVNLPSYRLPIHLKD